MPQIYIHYFGNESNESILEAHGLKPKLQEIDKMKPTQCPNCTELNKIDSKFCVKCRMVLSYDAYTETVQDNDKVKDELSQLRLDHKFEMGQMSDHINKLESTIENVFSKLNGGLTQFTGIKSIDKKVIERNALKYATDPDKIKELLD
jgi:hypothetical protein